MHRILVAAGLTLVAVSAAPPAEAAQVCAIALTAAEQTAGNLQNVIGAKLTRAQCQKGDTALVIVRGEAAMPNFAITYFCDMAMQVIVDPKDRTIVCGYAGEIRIPTPLVE